MKKRKDSTNDPPFYFVEGKGWRIHQCYTHPELGKLYLDKQWYRTKALAKADYPNVLQAAIDRKAKKESFSKYSRQLSSWEEFRETFKEHRLTDEVKGNTWYSKDRPMMNKYFNPLFSGMKTVDVFTEEMARKLKKAIQDGMTQYGYPVPTTDKNRAVAFYLKMLEFAFENDYMISEDEYRHCKAVMKRFKQDDGQIETHKREPIALTLEQVYSLLGKIDYKSTDYLLTKLLFQNAFRINEALALQVDNIDLEKKEITIKNTISQDENGTQKRFSRTKTKNGYRNVPITDEIAALIEARIRELKLKESDWLFPGIVDGKQMDSSAYRRRLARYCKEAGIPIVNPHSARHTFSTIAHQMGYRPEVIAKMLGHTAIVDVNIYNHLANQETMREMVESMFPKPAAA